MARREAKGGNYGLDNSSKVGDIAMSWHNNN